MGFSKPLSSRGVSFPKVQGISPDSSMSNSLPVEIYGSELDSNCEKEELNSDCDGDCLIRMENRVGMERDNGGYRSIYCLESNLLEGIRRLSFGLIPRTIFGQASPPSMKDERLLILIAPNIARKDSISTAAFSFSLSLQTKRSGSDWLLHSPFTSSFQVTASTPIKCSYSSAYPWITPQSGGDETGSTAGILLVFSIPWHSLAQWQRNRVVGEYSLEIAPLSKR
ncbi:hypothetical protein VNO77_46225 [Canavalia gladiata]|uniref:Uncharacterized protein n=1 Tax=Canavalia gladiata TaxID=3824 RepID=A0AAN9JGW4_CANGL